MRRKKNNMLYMNRVDSLFSACVSDLVKREYLKGTHRISVCRCLAEGTYWSARTPSSHCSLVTHPEPRHTGHETSLPPASFVIASAPRSATLSALTKHVLWNLCSQTASPSR